MNLWGKIFECMKEIEPIDKNMTVGEGKNSYKAVSEKEVLNKVKPVMIKYKLIMLPVKCNAKEIDFQYEKSGYQGKVDKKAITMTSLVTTWKVVDVDSGESIEIESPGNGADTQDKGAGKAFTYAYKNAIQKMFMLFSGEDTDNDHSDKLDNAGTQVSVTMLKEAINNVGTDEQTILDSYCDKYKKTCTELKFMSQEGKQYYYNRMTKAKK